MSKSLTRKVKHELDETLEDVAKTLRQCADGMSDDAEKAVEQASQALRQAAQGLADKTPPEMKDLAKKVVDEAKAHPIATSAAVLSAAAALVTIVGLGRRKAV
jgi:cell division septum initiation protein DivIVA